MYYVYVLYSRKFDNFYIGFTNNLKQRLAEHRLGKVYTSYRMPDWQLVYVEICISKKDAENRERQLKTGFGRGYLRRRLKNFLSGV
jgi:putative endonuclease